MQSARRATRFTQAAELRWCSPRERRELASHSMSAFHVHHYELEVTSMGSTSLPCSWLIFHEYIDPGQRQASARKCDCARWGRRLRFAGFGTVGAALSPLAFQDQRCGALVLSHCGDDDESFKCDRCLSGLASSQI